MRNASTELINFLAANNKFKFADCFTLTLVDGTKLRYTSTQSPIIATPPGEVDPVTFIAGQVFIRGLKLRSAIGIEVDEQEITIGCKPTYLIENVPMIQAIGLGLLDGARIKRDRFFLQEDWTTVVGGVTLFSGKVSNIGKIGILEAQASVVSDLDLLNISMPQNAYQPACLNTLFDGVCSLVKSSFADQGNVEAGSTKTVINWASATAGYYDLGTVLFEDGVNVGLRRTIRRSSGTSFTMVLPLPLTPGEGDSFVAYPGCDKTQSTCLNKFSNQDNFRGFPFVPVPETAI